MIKEGLAFILKAYRDYTGAGMYMAVYYIALLYIWKHDKEKENRCVLLYPFLILFAVIWNPIIAGSILRKLMNWDTEARLYWVFCLVPMIAYVAVRFIQSELDRKMRYINVAAILMLLITCGTLKFTNAAYQKATNDYRLPQEVVDICDIILEDSDKNKPKIVVPYDMVSFPRQYNRNIQLLYGENVKFRIQNEDDPVVRAVYDEMCKAEPDITILVKGLEENQCDYFVLDLSWQNLKGMNKDFEYQLLTSVGNYGIYKR